MPRTEHRWLALVALVSLAGFACAGQDTVPPVDALPPPSASSEFSGTYDVRGLTVEATTGQQREIAGTLQLDVQGNRYEVEFEMKTTAPDFDEPVPVDVRGSGSGLIIGTTFTGTTQERMALEPDGGLDEVELSGVDLPSQVGRKIVSTSQASFDADGTFHIMLQNHPGPNERYSPSVTVLEGRLRGGAPDR